MDTMQEEPFLNGKENGHQPSSTCASSQPSRRITVDRPAYTKPEFDAEFSLVEEQPSVSCCEKLKACCRTGCDKGVCAKPHWIVGNFLLDVFPFVETLRTYQWRKDIGMDALAGISVAMVHLPQGLGFALLAGVAPIYGLYASFWQVTMYALLGRCRHLSIGTMAVISLIIGAVVEKEAMIWKDSNTNSSLPNPSVMTPFTTGVTIHYPQVSMNFLNVNISETQPEVEGEAAEGLTEEDMYRASVASGVSLIAGVTMFLMGIFRLGVITTFMPSSFVGGFTTGAAFHVTTTQLKPLLNVNTVRYGGMFNLPRSVWAVIEAIPQTSIPDFIITLITFTFLVFIKEFINIRYKKKLKIPIPAELIVVVTATVLSYAASFAKRWGVKTIGFIPPGIPGPTMPNMERAATFTIDGIIAGITSFAISISMVDILTSKHKYKVDPNSELIAYGVTYGLSSFLHCFVGAAAPPRCFVMELTGGKTQVASVFTSLILLLVLLVIAPVFRYLPNASLACIIVVALFPLFKQFANLPRLWRISKPDLVIWLVTWAVCVFVDVSVSLGVGIFVAIMTVVLPSLSSKGFSYGNTGYLDLSAPIEKYKNVSPRKDIAVFRYESTLHFVTIKNFKNELFKATIDPASLQSAADKFNEAEVEATPSSEDYPNPLTESHRSPTAVLDLRVIVLDCSPICYIDLMGLDTLKQLKKDYQGIGVDFVLAYCNPNLLKKLEQAGMLEGNDKMDIYPSVQDALVYLSQ